MQSYNPAIPGKHVNKKKAGKPHVLAISALPSSLAALAATFSAVAFYIVTINNDAKPPPKPVVREYDVLRIRPRPGGLPHLEMFTWQNLTPAGTYLGLADRPIRLGGSLHLSWTLGSSGYFFFIDTDGSFISYQVFWERTSGARLPIM